MKVVYKAVPAFSDYQQVIMSASPGDPLPPKDKDLLPEEYLIREELKKARASIDDYDRELRRRTNELRQASQQIVDLQRESQRSKDFISDLPATYKT